MVAVDVLAFVVGVLIVALTFTSAVRTVVVARSETLLLPRVVLTSVRKITDPVANRTNTWEQRDRVLGYAAPFALVLLALTWIALVTIGFTPMFWAIEDRSWSEAWRISGSSVTTLGIAVTGDDFVGTTLEVVEAAIGLVLIALLISFLPTMYSAFSEREQTVSYMAVRAGTPPSGVDLLERFHRIGGTDDLREIWTRFEAWFDRLSETHTSFASVAYFRSPNPSRSWITTAGAVLDGAALHLAITPDLDPRAALCLRSGWTALRDIASAHHLELPDEVSPEDPISVSREEFDQACDRLAEAGLAVTEDRDRAWTDFAGWRVNYDAALVGLCAVVSAPHAPWSSDRSLRLQQTTMRSIMRSRRGRIRRLTRR
ncbi:MAG: hypothetical protein AAFZ07_19050 [Actinomycetota bacterium]